VIRRTAVASVSSPLHLHLRRQPRHRRQGRRQGRQQQQLSRLRRASPAVSVLTAGRRAYQTRVATAEYVADGISPRYSLHHVSPPHPLIFDHNFGK